MSITDIVGWGSLALFLIGFYVLYRFITSPGKRLEKLLKDGSALGLRRIAPNSPEKHILEVFLSRPSGIGERKIKLGAIYKTSRHEGYLLEMVDVHKFRKSGGGRVERYRDVLKLVLMEPTKLSTAFTVKPRPKMNVTYKLAMSVADKMGVGLKEVEQGLSEEFKKNFIVYSISPLDEYCPVSPRLQELFVRFARIPGGSANVMDFLEGGDIICLREGIVINLSRTRRPKKLEHLRAIIKFTEALFTEVAKKGNGIIH